MDTHSFLWYATDNDRITREARRILLDPTCDLLLSVVSVWEMAIKISLEKLRVTPSLEHLIRIATHQQGISLLEIRAKHALQVADLPFHHRDPFDRLLAAQAIVEDLPLLSADRIFDRYPLRRIW